MTSPLYTSGLEVNILILTGLMSSAADAADTKMTSKNVKYIMTVNPLEPTRRKKSKVPNFFGLYMAVLFQIGRPGNTKFTVRDFLTEAQQIIVT